MPLSTYNLLFSHIELKQVSRGLITDVSGNQLQVKGEIDLTLKFGRVPMKLKAWVVDLNLFAHILIGYPTMAQYCVEIKPHKDVMLVRKRNIISEIPRFIRPVIGNANSSSLMISKQKPRGILKSGNTKLVAVHRKSTIKK